jgi:hypothetical protein
MKLPYPSKAKDYPYYIIGYWLTVSLILFSLVTIFHILPNVSSDGKYVEDRACLKEAEIETNQPYTMTTTGCAEYGDKYYTPIGKELMTWLIMIFVGTGLATGGFGVYAWRDQKHKEYWEYLSKGKNT